MKEIKQSETKGAAKMKTFNEYCFYFQDREGKAMFILAQFDNGKFFSGITDYLDA